MNRRKLFSLFTIPFISRSSQTTKPNWEITMETLGFHRHKICKNGDDLWIRKLDNNKFNCAMTFCSWEDDAGREETLRNHYSSQVLTLHDYTWNKDKVK